MFFKKGLRDTSWIHKLAMKNPRISEDIFTIANKYALAEKATLDTKEQKKEKDSGHTDQPTSSKGHDKRKVDCSINVVEWPWCDKEYMPKLGEFEGFLNRICIFHPGEGTRPETMTDSKVLQMRFSRQPKALINGKSLRSPRASSLKLTRRSTTSMVAPSHMSQGGSRNSQPGRSWRSRLPPRSTLTEVPTTFDRSDHPDFVPKPGWYPLIVSPFVNMSSSTESLSMEVAP
jgi:hypothetical protein